MTTSTIPAPKPKPVPRYATDLPSRSGLRPFKTHQNLGHAKNAVMAQMRWSVGLTCNAVVYQLNEAGTEYEVLWTIPRGTKRPDLPWNQEQA